MRLRVEQALIYLLFLLLVKPHHGTMKQVTTFIISDTETKAQSIK